jgi:hypothetical protein
VGHGTANPPLVNRRKSPDLKHIQMQERSLMADTNTAGVSPYCCYKRQYGNGIDAEDKPFLLKPVFRLP